MPNRCTIFVFFTNKEIYFPKNKYLPKRKHRHIGLQKTASRKVTYSSIRMISTYQTHCQLSVFNIYIYQSTTYGLTHLTAIRHRQSVYNLLIINGLRIILTDDNKKHYSVIPSVYYAQQLPAKNRSASAKVSSLPTSSRRRPGLTQALITASPHTLR